MFSATLFLMAKNWKQSKCPSGGEWINKTGHNQTMEILPGNKQEQNTDTYYNMNAPQKHAK